VTRLAERRWTHDRSAWASGTYWGTPGPWHGEPDKVQWIDGTTQYACLAVRNPNWGDWCGYVGVPEGHPAYGLGAGAVSELGVAAHGGLNYAAPCQEEAPEGHGICHVPEPGHPDNVWWLGFDCGHSWDIRPRECAIPGLPRLLSPEAEYRTLDYVQTCCEILACQLHLVAQGIEL
jgi:hypothetical protein